MQVLKPHMRKRILESAKIEFIARGYNGSSMRKIANKAKMNVGNLYRYYKNKKTIFDEIMASDWEGAEHVRLVILADYHLGKREGKRENILNLLNNYPGDGLRRIIKQYS